MKTVLVTGGNRGIGLEICRQLDLLGYTVILGSRDLQKGKLASDSMGEHVIAKQLDVTNEESIFSLFNFIETEFGQLDVLINNAGLGANFKTNENSSFSGLKNAIKAKSQGFRKLVKTIAPILRKSGIIAQRESVSDIPMDNVKYLMETNLYGPWRMIQAFVPLLFKSDSGRIINISSGMGELNSLSGDYPGYRLSKSALNALTIMFSRELDDHGICVNTMCPGWVKTDMGGPDAPRDVSQGADTAVWLSTEDQIPTGKFFRDRKEISF